VSTAIPAAITALISTIQAASGLTGVTVHDGKPETAETPDWIAVGYDPQAETAVDFDREWAALGQQRMEEEFAIYCTLRSGSGDEVMSTRRARAFALLDIVSAAVAANPTLSGAVRVAAVHGQGSLLQAETGSGAAAGLRFRVDCQARISQ
jgi:hypothetical protein